MCGGYGIVVSPLDGTVWRANYPGIFGQPPLPDQTPNWASAAILAKEWELNALAKRLAALSGG